MIVNDLVKTYSYTKDKLEHFTISLFDLITEDWIEIKHPTIDEYIYLCDRDIVEWCNDLYEEGDINITVWTQEGDFDHFKKYYLK